MHVDSVSNASSFRNLMVSFSVTNYTKAPITMVAPRQNSWSTQNFPEFFSSSFEGCSCVMFMDLPPQTAKTLEDFVLIAPGKSASFVLNPAKLDGVDCEFEDQEQQSVQITYTPKPGDKWKIQLERGFKHRQEQDKIAQVRELIELLPKDTLVSNVFKFDVSVKE